MAGPPYGGAFAAAALRLLKAANAPAPKKTTGDATAVARGMTPSTDQFVKHCMEQRARAALLPPLGRDEAETLAFLGAGL